MPDALNNSSLSVVDPFPMYQISTELPFKSICIKESRIFSNKITFPHLSFTKYRNLLFNPLQIHLHSSPIRRQCYRNPEDQKKLHPLLIH